MEYITCLRGKARLLYRTGDHVVSFIQLKMKTIVLYIVASNFMCEYTTVTCQRITIYNTSNI